ncbi:hypothetical protein [Candidatus Poriferisocius sp.]|uniref:hypothetical protein n=1 Tax=Candidatus Poriferisocius sp. TaxID=3101276 RepID=UPI003B5B9D86
MSDATPFGDVIARVDAAIEGAQAVWKQQLAPGDLHRLKQEHQFDRRRGEPGGGLSQ